MYNLDGDYSKQRAEPPPSKLQSSVKIQQAGWPADHVTPRLNLGLSFRAIHL